MAEAGQAVLTVSAPRTALSHATSTSGNMKSRENSDSFFFSVNLSLRLSLMKVRYFDNNDDIFIRFEKNLRFVCVNGTVFCSSRRQAQ